MNKSQYTYTISRAIKNRIRLTFPIIPIPSDCWHISSVMYQNRTVPFEIIENTSEMPKIKLTSPELGEYTVTYFIKPNRGVK